MKHRDSSPEPEARHDDPDATPVEPDYARGSLDREGRSAQVGEAGEPNFATTDIDPGEPDPIPPGTPSFATKDIDPDAPDAVDPDRPSFATRDQQLP
jgi:hypothetical protein